eukprot:jgi/Chrzof1/2273/Cz11g09130.t1
MLLTLWATNIRCEGWTPAGASVLLYILSRGGHADAIADRASAQAAGYTSIEDDANNRQGQHSRAPKARFSNRSNRSNKLAVAPCAAGLAVRAAP